MAKPSMARVQRGKNSIDKYFTKVDGTSVTAKANDGIIKTPNASSEPVTHQSASKRRRLNDDGKLKPMASGAIMVPSSSTEYEGGDIEDDDLIALTAQGCEEVKGDFNVPGEEKGDSNVPGGEEGDFNVPGGEEGDFNVPGGETDFNVPSEDEDEDEDEDDDEDDDGDDDEDDDGDENEDEEEEDDWHGDNAFKVFETELLADYRENSKPVSDSVSKSRLGVGLRKVLEMLRKAAHSASFGTVMTTIYRDCLQNEPVELLFGDFIRGVEAPMIPLFENDTFTVQSFLSGNLHNAGDDIRQGVYIDVMTNKDETELIASYVGSAKIMQRRIKEHFQKVAQLKRGKARQHRYNRYYTKMQEDDLKSHHFVFAAFERRLPTGHVIMLEGIATILFNTLVERKKRAAYNSPHAWEEIQRIRKSTGLGLPKWVGLNSALQFLQCFVKRVPIKDRKCGGCPASGEDVVWRVTPAEWKEEFHGADSICQSCYLRRAHVHRNVKVSLEEWVEKRMRVCGGCGAKGHGIRWRVLLHAWRKNFQGIFVCLFCFRWAENNDGQKYNGQKRQGPHARKEGYVEEKDRECGGCSVSGEGIDWRVLPMTGKRTSQQARSIFARNVSGAGSQSLIVGRTRFKGNILYH